MSRFMWMSAVVASVAVVVLALRWALADFLLDRFGSLPGSSTRPVPREGERLPSRRSNSLESSFQARGD